MMMRRYVEMVMISRWTNMCDEEKSRYSAVIIEQWGNAVDECFDITGDS